MAFYTNGEYQFQGEFEGLRVNDMLSKLEPIFGEASKIEQDNLNLKKRRFLETKLFEEKTKIVKSIDLLTKLDYDRMFSWLLKQSKFCKIEEGGR